VHKEESTWSKSDFSAILVDAVEGHGHHRLTDARPKGVHLKIWKLWQLEMEEP
jgi:hypothetical protein